MINLVSNVVNSFVVTFIMLCVIEDLLGNKTKKKIKKFLIPYLVLTFITIFECYILNKTIRILIMCISFFTYIKIVYKQNIQKSILTTIFYQLGIMVSELLFSVVLFYIFNFDAKLMLENPIYNILLNIMIPIINLCIIKIPFVKNIYNYLIKITSKIGSKQLLFLSLIVILIADILGTVIYFKVDFIYLLIINTTLTLICFAIVIYTFKTKNSYNKVYDKYNTTLNSLKEYEDISDRYRISNHENKNQLLTIRNMIPKTNKKVISYIDAIVENKLKDNDKVTFETAKIPAGGLRGLIYSKVLLMKELEIEYELEISKEIKTVDLINKIDDSTMLDICKVIGVYLDNAIQEVEKLSDKHINIEMYLEDNLLIISILNNYEGTIEIDLLEESGYTSKGKGHGYGLTLSKEIINNNKNLTNEKSISQDIFTQTLKIKM